jgi:hypothetical protein
MKRPRPLSAPEAAARLGITEDQLLAAACDGNVYGSRLSLGVGWSFTEDGLRRFAEIRGLTYQDDAAETRPAA